MEVQKGRPKLDPHVIREELSKYPTILLSRRRVLPQRLAIAFQPNSTKGDKPSTATRQKNAHLSYQEVLRTDLHAFLPFIIAISPRACDARAVQEFFDNNQKSEFREKPIELDLDAKYFIEELAKEGGFDTDKLYKDWIKAIFPEPEDKIQKYSQLSIGLVSDLGDILSVAIKGSCQWSREREEGLYTTGCLTVLIPESKHHDISVTILVGHESGVELINRLQYGNFTEIDPKGRIQDLFTWTYMLTATDKKHRFSQVAMNKIGILDNKLFDAVLASTQWKWERNGGELTTDCLTVSTRIDQPEDMSITLKIGHERGLAWAKNLNLKPI